MPRAGANTVYWPHSTVRAEQQQPPAPWKTPPWEEITSLWHWPRSVRRYGQPRFYQADSVFRKSIKETKKATKRQLKHRTCPVSCVFYVTQKEPHTAESHGGTRDLPAQPRVAMWTITGHEHHVLASKHTHTHPETYLPAQNDLKKHANRQIETAHGSQPLSYNLPFHAGEGRKHSGFPDTKAVSLPFPPSRVPLEETSRLRKKTFFSFSCRCSGQLSLSQWVGWMSFLSFGSDCPCVVRCRTLCSSFSGSLSRNMC